MNYIFDILILKEDINKTSLTELTFEWSGQIISDQPRRFLNNSNLRFQEMEDKDYYKRFTKDSVDYKKYIALSLTSNHLMELEFIVNGDLNKLKTNELFMLLTEVIKLDSYLIFLIRDEEIIDKKFKVVNEDQLTDVIIKSLNFLNPIGAIITNI